MYNKVAPTLQRAVHIYGDIIGDMAKDPQDKAKKCNQEIQAILKKYNCGISAVPTFKVEMGGYLKVINEVKITPLIKLPDPPEGEEPRYIN